MPSNYYGQPGASDEWYTPKYIFDAMGVHFDMGVAAPNDGPKYVPASSYLHENADGLTFQWEPWEFIWMNPPFGKRNGIVPWLDKFFAHGNGVALTPDRTSAPWWQAAANRADAVLFVAGKVKFKRPDGSIGKSPGDGVTLFAAGPRGCEALDNASINGLGFLMRPRWGV